MDKVSDSIHSYHYPPCAKYNTKHFYMWAEFTLVKILLKKDDSYFTDKETDLEISRPEVNMFIHWNPSLGLQKTRHFFGPPTSL